jgi:2-C-methyl-D-erythritol 4-phosphate cytidylyltransferase
MTEQTTPLLKTAILLMAGTGERFGGSLPKQFHRLSGKKVYLHTLETFLTSALFDAVILVCPPLWVDAVKHEVQPYTKSCPLQIIAGGKTRQESSRKGLEACNPHTQIVVIHDAVRPFVSKEILERNVEAAQLYGAVDTCIPSADTLVEGRMEEQIRGIPDRAQWLRGQTPQSFSYPLIVKAHQMALQEQMESSSDDCSLALRMGLPVHSVQGSEENMKITSELDLILAEQVLRLKVKDMNNPSSPNALKGKRFAVTGGLGAIGGAIVALLQQEGAKAFPISRSAPVYKADLSVFSEAKQVFDALGPLDGLINSIGYLKAAPLSLMTSEEIQRHIGTNLTGVIHSCRCAHLKSGGHIINIASSSYSRGRKNYALYSSSKAALVNFTQGLSEEKTDLCVNVLAPHRTLSPLRTANFGQEEHSELLNPEDIAREVVLLLKQHELTGGLFEVRKHRIADVF